MKENKVFPKHPAAIQRIKQSFPAGKKDEQKQRLACSSRKRLKRNCEELKVEGWGHAINKLLTRLQKGTTIPSGLIEKAKKLDRFYIPTRYPNGFEQGAPMDYYLKEDAREALKYAREIINFCKKKIKTGK